MPASTPQELFLLLGMPPLFHAPPPLWVPPATRPLAPPLDQRSCCHTPTMFLGFVGFTSTHGSTSALRKFVPGSPKMSQAANGLGPETNVRGATLKGTAVVGVRGPNTTTARDTPSATSQ